MIYAAVAVAMIVGGMIGLLIGCAFGSARVIPMSPDARIRESEALARVLAATVVELQIHKRISRAAKRLVEAIQQWPELPTEWRGEIDDVDDALTDLMEAQRDIERP